MRIGIQLYAVRNSCGNDLPGTLAALADAGYDGVEFAGHYDLSAEKLREMLDNVGLQACGDHLHMADLLGEAFDETVAFQKTLGNPWLVISSIREEEYTSSAEAWRRCVDIVSDCARKAGAAGMSLALHNHWQEFEPLADSTWFDILFSAAAPEVGMQLDVGWALRAGQDPAELIRRYPGRARTIHAREYSAADDATILGQGEVDWPSVFDACESVGRTEWYIVERQPRPEGEIEAAAKTIQALRDMGR